MAEYRDQFMQDADNEEARAAFERAGRHPAEYPLFAAIYHVLSMAPSSQRYERDEVASEAFDALDHLLTDGHWHDWKETGETRLEWNGEELEVYEDNGGDWQFRQSYAVEGPGDIYGAGSDPGLPRHSIGDRAPGDHPPGHRASGDRAPGAGPGPQG